MAHRLDANGDEIIRPRNVRYTAEDGRSEVGPVVGFLADGRIIVGCEDGSVVHLDPATVVCFGRIEGAVVVDRGPGQPPLII
jgi:hypothetical protein